MIKLTCQNILEHLTLSLVKECDNINEDIIRIATPFTYPNGSHIDLFISEIKDNFFDNYKISDLCQTFSYMLDLEIEIDSTKKRKTIIEEICEDSDVIYENAEFFTKISNITDIKQKTIDLIQVCIRAIDISFTVRKTGTNRFKKEIDNFLSTSNLTYEPDFSLLCDEKQVSVDYLTKGKSSKSLIQLLSPQGIKSKTGQTTFLKWYDIDKHYNNYGYITIYDIENAEIPEYDINRIQDYSKVYKFPKQKEELSEILVA